MGEVAEADLGHHIVIGGGDSRVLEKERKSLEIDISLMIWKT